MGAHSQVKVIGSNGQISLGKEFAGKTVIVNKTGKGLWTIQEGQFIPDSEKWLYQAGNLDKLEQALDWAEKNKPVDNFDKLIKEMEDGRKKENKNRHE